MIRVLEYIAARLPEESHDDIHDVLLGNINQPSSLVAEVTALREEFLSLQRNIND